MATFNSTITWGTATTSTLTASGLATWIDTTTITNIVPLEFASSAAVFFSSTQAPTLPGTVYWRDLNKQMTMLNDSVNWVPYSDGAYLVNSFTATLPLGSIVAHGTTLLSFSRCNTAGYGGVLGGLAEVIGNGRSGITRFGGVGPALVTGTCTMGDVLVSHAINGVGGALQSATAFAGSYTNQTLKPGLEVAFALWSNAGAAGTVTCLFVR